MATGNVSAADLIDLARYPLGDLEAHDGARLVESGRCTIDRDGILVLDGFVTPDAATLMTAEAEAVAHEAWFCLHRHTVYQTPGDPDLPADDARSRLVKSDKGNVAKDRIPADGPLRALFDWTPLRSFLAAVLGLHELHPYGDPLAGLMINVNRTGETLGWHFDNAEFAVTLMLKPPLAGGTFRYLPGIRSGDAAEHAAVNRVLEGDETGLIDLAPPAGTLMIFRGRESLHCVTPVIGPQARLVGVLSYAREPGRTMGAQSQRLFHGRVS
ncbi:MAG: 2OG-Fe(II) oxygenase [Alphaproteobacteria bacterium]|jgi:hypothetical protein|nr:2OG-Fe(II) oxygenase [Rhodospirillaceae bacterium]MBT6510285.1 2OG-Fe(II) oxygenase [Rhodospirillaceae bacterium]MBT7648039.1 2OG-Fe(II) oxygenase [Rhodospirillaceae bacterium]MDG2482776.1 2OG-Fe(II) oxygenase [Alphaproteobacteria bacterium]